MNVKKLAIIGAIALVVIGCVVAAGCTSNTTTQQTTVQSSDSIAGVWFSEFTDNAGQKVKETDTVLNNGTARYRYVYEDGTAKTGVFTWTRNTDGTFAVKTSEGQNLTWKLNAAKDTVTSTSGHTFTKKFAETSDAAKIIGVWADDGKYRLVTMNGDGTGTYLYKGTENSKSEFTWSVSEPGKIKLRYVSGILTNGENLAGKESIWTYDREKDTFTTGGLTGTTHVFVHPTENMDGLTITKFTSSETPATTGKCPVVGTWVGNYSSENTDYTVIQIINADGTGKWIRLENDERNTFVDSYESTFDKKDWDGEFDKKSSNGNTYKMVYNPATQTITESLANNIKITFKKIEPIVGTWTGISSEKIGKGNSTCIINPNGTGISTISYDDGTCKVDKLTWKKNADGSYALVYSDGKQIVYTVDSTGKTMKTNDGRTKTKQFASTTLLSPVTGAWYNKEHNLLAVLNGDGTGLYKTEKGISKFTWKVNDNGKYTVSYLSGTSLFDGSNLAGKTFEWTFDPKSNALISSKEVKFVRPTESIKDKITLY